MMTGALIALDHPRSGDYAAAMRIRTAIFLSAALSLPASCKTIPRPAPSDAAYKKLELRGRDQLSQANYAGARTTFQELLGKFPDRPETSDVELLLAVAEYNLGQKSRARSLREKVAREGATPEIQARALSGLGWMELRDDHYESAARSYKAAASLEGDRDRKAHLLSWAGVASQRAGRFEEARGLFRQAIETAPGSNSATRAREGLLYPDHFAVQTGAFADPSNAARQKEMLAAKGFPAQVLTVDAPSGKLHCVRVGNFSARDQAQTLLESIRTAKVLPVSARIGVRP